ncbi:YktB family protein [Paenibacillus alkalitolerans]|uniref:YktB family protein n=1 Tax=Paenibacillus alkalitolerans TaxID=2799335 RepID=UPI0018F7C6C0|nr:DUF1054 domain-containing protein [Paenibacillus alkalitolerans]
MAFNGFTSEDFDVFHIQGLEERMAAIRERIQPKFKAIGETVANGLAVPAGSEMCLHIAKHARRSVNPPKDTWLAIAANKRGYKQHPHFQIGLFDDHVFVWLAFIYELPDKVNIANRFLDEIDTVAKTIPPDFVLSFDHMKKDAVSMERLGEEGLVKSIERFRDVKKAELLIGRHIAPADPILKDGNTFTKVAMDTFETLMPIYKLSLGANP